MLISVFVLISLIIGIYCYLSIRKIESFYKQIQSGKDHLISFDEGNRVIYYLFLQKSTILGDIILLNKITKLLSKQHPIVLYDLNPERPEDIDLVKALKINSVPVIYKMGNNKTEEVFSYKMLYDHPEMKRKDILKYLQKEAN